jgi:dsRNA-specific ribonuclease
MWTEYAEKHKGVFLRIQPSLAKDSKFQLFRPVIYREKRPPLYEDTLEFIAGALFGDREAQIKEIVERIIYTKTLVWQHEGEYRLAIPIRGKEKPWCTLPYHRKR